MLQPCRVSPRDLLAVFLTTQCRALFKVCEYKYVDPLLHVLHVHHTCHTLTGVHAHTHPSRHTSIHVHTHHTAIMVVKSN